MVGEKTQPKRLGRPPKSTERPKNGSFTFRIRPGMREWLETNAKTRGVSISEEIEQRLEQSRHRAADPYMDAALRMAGASCDVIQQLLGKGIGDDPFVRASCAEAARSAITLVGGLAQTAGSPDTQAALQTDAEAFGLIVAMVVQAKRDKIESEYIDGLYGVLNLVVARRRHEDEHQQRVREATAHLLRSYAPVSPESAATSDLELVEAPTAATLPRRKSKAGAKVDMS